MGNTKDAEVAAGASVAATGLSIPALHTAAVTVIAKTAALSSAASFGASVTTALVTFIPFAAPVIAIGAGIYAIKRFSEENA